MAFCNLFMEQPSYITYGRGITQTYHTIKQGNNYN